MTTNKVLYDAMVIDPNKMSRVIKIVDLIKSKSSIYKDVELATGVLWFVIGVIHYRESGNSFKHHLHNGDPLTERTTHVPAGRPIKGNPPFTWEDSAIDAIRLQKLDKVTDWSTASVLDLLEKYNGLGYRKKGVPSPYLWSWSSVYKKGKYVADGKYDTNVIDQQCGTAVLLKLLP